MQNHNYKIAIINPYRPDGMTRTILDGILALNADGSNIDFKISSKFDYVLPVNDHYLSQDQFIEFAKEADFIFIFWSKDGTDFGLAETINCWDKTIYIDGSETGHNNRYDFYVQRSILNLTYKKNGKIEENMLKKCAFYFRREKPYLDGIKPLPFGIETRYIQNYKEEMKKDIDFTCIFGQDEYPLLRRYCREWLEKYCAQNNFNCFTQKTKTPEEFYKLLARSKVGISVGGGGFDSYRFWETLGNNCLLLTEKIDIYQPDSKKLNYKRIWEFSNLSDFQYQLNKMGDFLRKEYNQKNLTEEYKKIISEHSSKTRVSEIIKTFNDSKNEK